MATIPKLNPGNRGIYAQITADRDKLLDHFALAPDRDRFMMQKVRYLYSVIGSNDRAASFIIGRLLPQLPPESKASRNANLPKKQDERKRLAGNKFPLVAPVSRMSELNGALIPLIESDSLRLSTVASEPTSSVDWPQNVVRQIESFLGISTWPATPTSWLQWQEFVYTDKMLTVLIRKQAKRQFGGFSTAADGRRQDLVDNIREVIFLEGISAAHRRATAVQRTASGQALDLRAEILGAAPLRKGAPLRKHAPLQKHAKRLADRMEERRNTEHLDADAVDEQKSVRVSKRRVSEHVLQQATGTTQDDPLLTEALWALPRLYGAILRLRYKGFKDHEVADQLNAYGRELARIVELCRETDRQLDEVVGESDLAEEHDSTWPADLDELAAEADEFSALTAGKVKTIRLKKIPPLLKDFLPPE